MPEHFYGVWKITDKQQRLDCARADGRKYVMILLVKKTNNN